MGPMLSCNCNLVQRTVVSVYSEDIGFQGSRATVRSTGGYIIFLVGPLHDALLQVFKFIPQYS
jgi:hypothetical protein